MTNPAAESDEGSGQPPIVPTTADSPEGSAALSAAQTARIAAEAKMLPSAIGLLPVEGVLLGIDHGVKRIGLSICNPEQTLAVSLTVHQVQPAQVEERFFRKLIEEYRPKGILIGLPLHMHGGESRQSELVRTFGRWLGTLSGLPVDYWDERLSSHTAETMLWEQGRSPSRHKADIDRLAALVILQSFLDARRPRRPLPPAANPTVSDAAGESDPSMADS